MNLKEIKEIVNLMNDNNLGEIEVERDGIKLKIKKEGAGASYIQAPLPIQSVPAPAASVMPTSTVETVSPKTGVKEIKSPMVGTFYRASSPEAAPFIEVGQIVEVGQVVCIVEAMKLMNEIKSEVKGKVVAVNVDNAEPVEFGQPLFDVEPV